MSEYMPCPPLSASSSFSSSSSVSQPFTPTSGRSTPTGFSVDFSSPFPPFSHTPHRIELTHSPTNIPTNYFCNDGTSGVGSTLYQDVSTTQFSHGLATPAAQATPIRKSDMEIGLHFNNVSGENISGGMKKLLFGDNDSQTPLCDISPQDLNGRSEQQLPRHWDDSLVPLPLPNCFVNSLVADRALEIDMHPPSIGSPISFAPISFATFHHLPNEWQLGPSGSLPTKAKRSVAVEQAQKRTSMLQKAQQRQRDRGARPPVEAKAKFPCEYPGCELRYLRLEHMKRHMKG